MMSIVLAAVLVFSGVVSGDPDQQQKLARAVSQFGQRLHEQIAVDKRTNVYSPVSTHASLSMIYMGAKADTAKELQQLLSLTELSGSLPSDTYRDLISDLQSISEITYASPKGILVKSKSQIENDFKNEVDSKYSSKVSPISLNAPGGPEKEMNEYVAQKTQRLIRDLIPKDLINKDSSMVVVSAFVINGTFEDQFDECNTEKKDFFESEDKVSKVDMMNDTQSVLFKRDEEAEADVVQLPLKGGRIDLVIVLPHERNGIDKLEKRLVKEDNVENLLKDLSKKKVSLEIPRIKVDSTYQLIAPLKNLGLSKAVTPGTADFKGISKAGDVSLTQVLHRAIIDIEEVGAETTEGSQEGKEDEEHTKPSEDFEETFRADHPFMFFIRDRQTGMRLLAGKFSN